MTNLSNLNIFIESRLERATYFRSVRLNGKIFNRVIIDQHYKLRHAESVNDQLILELLLEMDDGYFKLEASDGEFDYHAASPIFLHRRPYRVIFVNEFGEDYVGIVNVYRVAEE